MTAQTGIKAQRSTFLRAYWPVIGALLIAYLGWWMLMREQTSAVVMAIGMAGMLVCLPLFKQEKIRGSILQHSYYAPQVRLWMQNTSLMLWALNGCQDEPLR